MAKKNEALPPEPPEPTPAAATQDPPPPDPGPDPGATEPEEEVGTETARIDSPSNIVTLKAPPDCGPFIYHDGEQIPVKGSGENKGIELDRTRHAALIEQLQLHHGFDYVRG